MTLKRSEYAQYMKTQSIFRERLFAYMKAHKISIVQLARRIPVAFVTMARFLNDDKDVRFEILFRIEEFLDNESNLQVKKDLV